jgi:short-subunit dehydrogenase
MKEIGPVDMLINTAGVGAFDLAENISEEFIHEMIDINLKGTIFCTQEVVSQMKERNRGSVINIISTAGKQGSREAGESE